MRNETTSTGFRPVLGIWAGVSTIVAVVVGAGIFSVPQQVAQYLRGSGDILLLWGVVGLVCVVIALVYAEIGARFPLAGADYLALRQAYGRHLAFVFGWRGLAVAHPSNRAALALVGAQYAVVLVPALAGAEIGLGVAILVALGLINAAGVRQASALHVLLTLIKMGLLVVFVVLALVLVAPGEQSQSGGDFGTSSASLSENPATDASPLERWALASLLVFFAYTGFPRIVQLTEEFRDPQRTLPWALGLAIGGIVLLYLAINYVYLHVLGLEGVRATATVGADAMAVVFGPGGASLVAFIILVSVVGSMSVSIMAASRLYYAMARRGDFFRGLARLHPEARVPRRAIAVHLGLAVVFLVVRGNFDDLVISATFLNLAFYALRTQSLFVLRRRNLGVEGGFRMPFYPWLPLCALACMYAVLITRLVVDWRRAWFDVVVLAVGLVASWIWFRRADADAAADAEVDPSEAGSVGASR